MPYRKLFPCNALCALLLVVASCADSGSAGELRNGSFGYRCISDRDPVCSRDNNFANSYLKEVPKKVAVGASFGVAFLAESSAAQDGSAVLAPVSERFLEATNEAGLMVMRARKPGAAGILASR